MNHNSKNYTLAFFVLVVAIIVGIVSLVVGRPPIPATLSEFFPPVEEIEYFNITAEGEQTGGNVTRAEEDIQTLVTLAQAVEMVPEQKSYVGKKFEGTMYHIQMAYSGTKYDFYIATDGSIYHANGKYFPVAGEEMDAVYAWLEDFCG